MNIKMQEILEIYKIKQVNDFLTKYIGQTLEEEDLSYKKVKANWNFVGNNSSNGSVINMVKNGEKGIVERITNAVDAVIECQKKKNKIGPASSPRVIIESAFPKFYNICNDVILGKSSLSSSDATNQVVLAINDGSKSSLPTFDIIDKGIGIKGESFIDTILSINKGNKLSKEKGYLIGAFGQGGSTSLPFAEATIIISKFENIYYFTIIKSVDLVEYKNYCFVYLIFENKIGTLEYDGEAFEDEYINDFLNSESGTFIRMIETDVSKSFRENPIYAPGSFGDYVNTELYKVSLPVRMIENRLAFKERRPDICNSYGSYLKMHAWKYMRDEYSGSIFIEHHNNPYRIDYYFILPDDQEKWSNDNECKEIYRQVNVHLDPIMYIVNGQYIAGERFAKLKNAGLNFLQYRLIVVIDLDILGTEKYKFFTSDRSQIRDSDLTHGFLDTVIAKLKNEAKINEINRIIAQNSINSLIDNEIITNISNKVKNIYNKYLQGNGVIRISSTGEARLVKEEEVFFDSIFQLELGTSRRSYFKDQSVNVVLKTSANKIVNEAAEINVNLDGRRRLSYTPTIMNGKIQYAFSKLLPGHHTVSFDLLENHVIKMTSPLYEFDVLDEKSPERKISEEQMKNKTLNLRIIPVANRDLIVDIVKNQVEKSIVAYICLEHPMMDEVYGRSSSTEVQMIKQKLIEPIVLFALSMGEKYDDIESFEEKNDLIVSLSKTIVFSLMNN